MAGESDVTLQIVEETPIVIELVQTGPAGTPGAAGGIQTIVPGTGIAVDDTDPDNPIVSATESGGGIVESIVAGDNVQVDDTDPANPIVSSTASGTVESVVAGKNIDVNITDPANPIVSTEDDPSFQTVIIGGDGNGTTILNSAVPDGDSRSYTLPTTGSTIPSMDDVLAEVGSISGTPGSVVIVSDVNTTEATLLLRKITHLLIGEVIKGENIAANSIWFDHEASGFSSRIWVDDGQPLTADRTLEIPDEDGTIATREWVEDNPSGGGIESVVAGDNISVDVTDPANPIVSTPDVTATSIGLGNVNNTSDANKPISTATQTALDAKLDDSQKGAASGLAELDGSGLVPTSQLPSYVDDVVVVADFAALPGTGETGKIYVTIDNNLTYRWNGSGYTEISASLALGETSSTAYRGDRGKTAYDHSQIVTGNPHAVTKSEVGLGNADNTSDVNKPISTATQTALNLKADDSAVVHDTGDETIAGVKTFSSDPLIPDEAYDATAWNGSLEPPTKNAVRDKLESMSGSGQTLYDHIVAASGGTHTTLQAAIAAASNGDTIFVRSGTYALVAGVTTTLTDLTIIGENPETAIISCTTFAMEFTGARVTIKNLSFTVTSGSFYHDSDNGSVLNCKIAYSTAATGTPRIKFGGTASIVANNRIIYSTASNSYGGIEFMGASIEASGNAFDMAYCHQTSNEASIVLSATGINFSGNKITFNAMPAAGAYFAIRTSSSAINVTGNHFTGANTRCAVIYMNGFYNNFSSNECYNFSIMAYMVQTSCSVTDNHFYGGAGGNNIINIAGNNFTVSSNHINAENDTTGTMIVTGSSAQQGVIANNHVYGGIRSIDLGATSGAVVVSGNFLRILSTASSGRGIALNSPSNTVVGNTIYGQNTTNAIAISVDSPHNTIVGNNIRNFASFCTVGSTGDYSIIASNTASQSGATGLVIASAALEVTAYGNILAAGATITNSEPTASIYDNRFVGGTTATAGGQVLTNKIITVRNSSGATINAGEIVVFRALAAGNEITTTTTGGDPKVYGMALTAISNNTNGSVLVDGKTTLLKVNGTTDIAVGDFISSYTTAGIGQKATAGQTAIAIALEAYSTDDSSGVIDALIIPPRII